MHLKIITFNCFGTPIAKGRLTRFKLIAKAIKKLKPDLIFLQEVILTKDRKHLQDILGQDYYFYPQQHKFLQGGLLTISRWPAANYRFIKFKNQKSTSLWSWTDKLLNKGFQIIEIYSDNRQRDHWVAINTHLLANYHNHPTEQLTNVQQIK